MNVRHPGEDLLIAFALGDLEAGAGRDEIAAHSNECDACGQLVARLAAGLERYRATTPREAPARVLVRLLEAQAAAVSRPARVRWTLRPAMALAVAALLAVVFLGGFWAGRNSAPEEVRLPDDTVLAFPLPDPPVIAFHPAVATE